MGQAHRHRLLKLTDRLPAGHPPPHQAAIVGAYAMIVFSRMAGLASLAVASAATAATPAIAHTATVTSPAGPFADRIPVAATGSGAADAMRDASAVRGHGTGSITTIYARNDKGLIELQALRGAAPSSGADLEYYFSPDDRVLLSNLGGFSYDVFRNGSGALDSVRRPTWRFRVGDKPRISSALKPDRQAELPEPATWAMLLIGFGAVGAALRRRIRRSNDAFEQKLRNLAAGIAD